MTASGDCFTLWGWTVGLSIMALSICVSLGVFHFALGLLCSNILGGQLCTGPVDSTLSFREGTVQEFSFIQSVSKEVGETTL